MLRLLLFVALVSCASMAHAITVACSPHDVKNAIVVKPHSDGARQVFYVLFPRQYRGEKFSRASITINGKNKSLVSVPLAAELSSNQDWSSKLVAFVQTVHSTSSLSVQAEYGCAWRLTAELPR